jgi:hypothetical protein
MERLHVASRVARFRFAASPIEIEAEPIELAASPFEISAGPFEINAAPNEIAAGADVFASSPFEICDDRPGKAAKSFGWNGRACVAPSFACGLHRAASRAFNARPAARGRGGSSPNGSYERQSSTAEAPTTMSHEPHSIPESRADGDLREARSITKSAC